MKNNWYITESDIEVYNNLIKKDGRNGAPTLRNKFTKIIEIYREIIGDPTEKVYFVEFWDNYVSYTIEYEMYCTNEHIDLNLLKTPGWENVLKEQLQKEKIQNQISELKHKIDEYSKIKDKAIKIAKKAFVFHLGKKLHEIDNGEFEASYQDDKVLITYKSCWVAGEIDDSGSFSFPLEFLVIDDWKEKLYEYIQHQKEVGAL